MSSTIPQQKGNLIIVFAILYLYDLSNKKFIYSVNIIIIMATATDLKIELITQFDNILAVANINNMIERFNKGSKQYELSVNNLSGGRDAIGIIDNFVTGDPRRYTIYIKVAGTQLTLEKGIIGEAVLNSTEFATQETAFTTKLEILRAQIYTDSITMTSTIGANIVNRLS